MPRRKVPLADRKRALVACNLCKTHKKRCDGQVPCANCSRRGCGEACSYGDDAPSGSQTPVMDRSGTSRARSKVTSPAGTLSSAPSATPYRTSHRMLHNAQGEKVYVGRSASIAFLQLVRETVTQQIGVTDFSQHTARDHMLEAKHIGYDDLQVPVVVDADQRREYIDLYSVATSGILHVFPKNEIFYVTCIEDETRDPYHFATGRLVLAIGAQCSPRLHVHRRNEIQLFEQGRKAAMDGMLENPCLGLVSVFLLMAFYMLGACQRNAAFMYLGVAVRAAYVLGLHNTESYGQLAEAEGQHRAALWQSLVSVDEMISSILDRPSAISIQHVREGPPTEIFDSLVPSKDVVAFGAAYHLSKIVAEIGEKLQEKKALTIACAEKQLQELRKWTQGLPESLKNHSEGEVQSIEAQQGVVGSLHVSCYYYFAVVLVSRPFLIAHLSERHAISIGPTSNKASSEATKGELRVADMAYACLRAAISMSQTCSDVARSASLFGNMRLLKAWIFAAGLVIGFHMFAVPTLDLELEEAYKEIHAALNTLAKHSLQASHYYDILSFLSNAIQQRRQSLGSNINRPSELVTDRILNFRPNRIDQEETPGQASQTNAVPDISGENAMAGQDATDFSGLQLEMDDSIWSWENAVSQIWDQSLGDPFSAVDYGAFQDLRDKS